MKMIRLLAIPAVVALLSAGLVFAQSDEIDIDVPIVVSPNVVNLESEGIWVTVHAEIAYSLVVKSTVMLNGIPVEVTKYDARGELVAKFLLEDVRDILVPGDNELTLTGWTTNEEFLSGTDEIVVISQSGRSK